MANYQEMYLTLFRAVTKAVTLLQQAQLETEELYINTDEPCITILPEVDANSRGKERDNN